MIEDKRTENNLRTIVRHSHLAENIVIIDGQEGCGKTLFGLIVSSIDRVEILNYAFEIEFICRLYKLNKITLDAATTFVKMISDHKLYQSMMGRETNFRYSDLSSVFNNPNAFKYFKRNSKKCSSLRSVSEMSETSFKSYRIVNKKLCALTKKDFNLDKYNMPRNNYEKTYEANGIIDIYKTKNILKNTLLGNKVLPFKVDDFNSEIDNSNDFKLVETFFYQILLISNFFLKMNFQYTIYNIL